MNDLSFVVLDIVTTALCSSSFLPYIVTFRYFPYIVGFVDS